MKTVDVLYFDGCPNADIAADHARAAVERANTLAEVRLVRIEHAEDAIRHRFLGSPTIRVDGVDVDGSAHTRTDFGLMCRLYMIDGRLAGAPAVGWIEAALRGTANREVGGSVTAPCCATPETKEQPEG